MNKRSRRAHINWHRRFRDQLSHCLISEVIAKERLEKLQAACRELNAGFQGDGAYGGSVSLEHIEAIRRLI